MAISPDATANIISWKLKHFAACAMLRMPGKYAKLLDNTKYT